MIEERTVLEAIMIKVGDKLPAAELLAFGDMQIIKVNLAERLKGKKVLLFGFPGAFSPVCAGMHVPTYIELFDQIMAKGVDEIIGISVNDVAVLLAFTQAMHAEGKITFLSDGDAEFSKSVGMTHDASFWGAGTRSLRYVAVVEDGVVKHIDIEERPDVCSVTKAEEILKFL
jgi:glutaredoxin/glutathione-dependent peroxiredoxin